VPYPTGAPRSLAIIVDDAVEAPFVVRNVKAMLDGELREAGDVNPGRAPIATWDDLPVGEHTVVVEADVTYPRSLGAKSECSVHVEAKRTLLVADEPALVAVRLGLSNAFVRFDERVTLTVAIRGAAMAREEIEAADRREVDPSCVDVAPPMEPLCPERPAGTSHRYDDHLSSRVCP
jgi:hypothetical protein